MSDDAPQLVVRTARAAVRLLFRAKARTRYFLLRRWRHYSSRVSRALIRFTRRRRKAAEWARVRRHEHTVERRAVRAGRGRSPLVIGPWVSEVGFEVLYWIPFLHWLKAECGWDPATAVAISRGGVASWYQGLAETYVEIFDAVTPEEFAARNETRRAAADGNIKQMQPSAFDDELVAYARRVAGFGRHTLVHPSLMYQLFRQFWLGHRPVTHVAERTRFATWNLPGQLDLGNLPDDYVAVKLYTARSLPDTGRNRDVVRSLIEHLARVTNVVTLDTAFAADDHEDYNLDHRERLIDLKDRMTAGNNLEVQTHVIARSRAFVGTCGALAWLAPMLGVPTVSLFSDDAFLREHLYFARHAYRAMGAARFTTVDVGAFEPMGLTTLSDLTRAD